MAANLSLAQATVTDDNGQQIGKDEPVLIRENVLRVGVGDSRTYPNVQAVTQVGRGRWEVRFPGSQILTIVRAADCGCRGAS